MLLDLVWRRRLPLRSCACARPPFPRAGALPSDAPPSDPARLPSDPVRLTPFLRSRAHLSSLLRSLPRAHPSLPARCFPPISFPRADQLISTPSRGGPALRASLGGRPSSPPAGTPPPPPGRRRPRTPVEAQCTPPPGKAFPEIYNKLNCAATPPLRRRTGRHDLLGVNDDCKLRFLELKAKRTYRYITFKIEEKQKQIVVDKLGEPTMSYEDFTACLPAEECRYAIYDFDFVTEENCQKSKIFFIAWRLEKNYQKSVTGWITHILAKNLYRMWENYGKIQPFRKLTHGEVFCNFLTVHSTSWKIWTD